MGAEFFRERFAFFSSADGDRLVSEFIRELNAKMAESADAKYGDEVARDRSGATHRVEGGDPGAKQRRSFGGVERVWHRGNGFPRRNHVFAVAAVVVDAGPLFIGTVDEIAAAAIDAGEIVAA